MLHAVARLVLELRNAKATVIGPAPEYEREEAPGRWLTLLGSSGAGKSMLARRVWKWFMDIGRHYADPVTQGNLTRRGQFVRWETFIEECRNGSYGRLRDMRDDWLVIVDDFGSVRDPSGFAADLLYRVQEARVKRWTVFTSNFSLDEIGERFDKRCASRFARDNATVVTVDVPDYAER